MQQAGATAATLVATAALAAAVTGSAANSSAGRTPSIALVHSTPLVVSGRRFQPAESVRVTLAARPISVRVVRASAAGSFVASFGNQRLGRCGGFSIRAVGSRGSIAALKMPLPACMPARTTG